MKPGPVIRQIRKEKGMRQATLAELAGLKQPNLSRIENSVVFPRPRTMEKIAEALGVPTSLFFDEQQHARAMETERTWRDLKGKKLYVYAGPPDESLQQLVNPPGTIGRLVSITPMTYTGKEPCAGEKLTIVFETPPPADIRFMSVDYSRGLVPDKPKSAPPEG